MAPSQKSGSVSITEFLIAKGIVSSSNQASTLLAVVIVVLIMISGAIVVSANVGQSHKITPTENQAMYPLRAAPPSTR
jgi:hypothetical protein